MHFVNCEKSWIDIFAALLTPSVACFAGWIAYMQWKINKDKLRFDLWQKRYLVYKALIALLDAIEKNNYSIIGEEWKQFNIQNNKCVFLFDNDVVTYIEYVKDIALRLHSIGNKLKEDKFTSEQIGKLADDFEKLQNELHDQYDRSKKEFSNYLRFKY